MKQKSNLKSKSKKTHKEPKRSKFLQILADWGKASSYAINR